MRIKALAISLSAAAVLAGCNNGGDQVATTATPTPTPTVPATPTATAPGLTGDPLTGLAPGKGPIVAIKVDNAPLARQYQTGLRQASVVYQELVEGGLTRFMAIFESPSATSEVGPVRSGRESDVNILRAYGRAALGFSGAQPGVFKIIRAAARAGLLIEASRDSAPGLYRGGAQRRDARNFFVVPARLGKAKGGAQPRDVGFRFGPLAGGLPTASMSATFSPGNTIKFRYAWRTHSWVITQGGRTVPFSPANIIVQYVTVKPSRFHDVHHMNTPLTISTGGGKSFVLRDGRRIPGTWKRLGYGATHYLNAAGRDVLMRPGQTWVLLLPKGRGISFG